MNNFKIIVFLFIGVMFLGGLLNFRFKQIDKTTAGEINITLLMDRLQSQRFWAPEKERGFLSTRYVLKNNDSIISSFFILEGDELYRHPYIEKVTSDSIFLRHYFGGPILIGLDQEKCIIENANFIFLSKLDSTYKKQLIGWMKETYVSTPPK